MLYVLERRERGALHIRLIFLFFCPLTKNSKIIKSKKMHIVVHIASLIGCKVI